MTAVTLPETPRIGYRPLALAVIWLLLLAAPYWMPFIGGYTALGTRILVFGLAAMSLNFLLGFTGVLSFGHAAYFGLGAYGTGLALKFLATPRILREPRASTRAFSTASNTSLAAPWSGLSLACSLAS